MKLFTSLILLFLGSLGQVQAQVPQLINYQGRVAVGTTNFNGSGQFKFAFVNTDGSTTYWSNDGSSTAGSQPANGVTLNVTQGLYSLLLGDTSLPNMTAVPATVFTNSDVRLRIWFNDGANGWQLLSPDQRIAAVGYAMLAGNVPNGAITSAQLADGAVGASQIAPGAIGGTQLATNLVVNGLFSAQKLSTSGSLSIPATTNSTTGVISQNGQPILQSYGATNLFLGPNAGNFTLTGYANTGMGVRALGSLTTGINNTATGAGAMPVNTFGSHNVAYGNATLSRVTNASYNVAIGDSALAAVAVGSNNIAIGANVLSVPPVGSTNVVIGGTNSVPIGNNNIYVSGSVTNVTSTGESGTIRIGVQSVQTNAYIAGIYGTASSATTNTAPVSVTSAGQVFAMSPSYGYITPPPRMRLPAICAAAARSSPPRLTPICSASSVIPMADRAPSLRCLISRTPSRPRAVI